MRVNRLEIFGFKSFMDRIVLPLESGITAVVGPNGCGKSNVVDALRWVLGETRAKNLRGGVLEDVIFNGTDRLRPLGLAEVTVTLRSEDKNFFSDLTSPALEAELLADQVLESENLSSARDSQVDHPGDQRESESCEGQSLTLAERPVLKVIDGKGAKGSQPCQVDLSCSMEAKSEQHSSPAASLSNRFSWLRSVNEVQITRRLYRSGESEFFINRVACRLKDIKDLFRAVGLSTRAYTIVAQNEVLRVVTAKPEERRQLIEEAAGVLGFRDKISAATRRLEDTLQNTARLGDIVTEVARQVGSLRRQAARARNRQTLKDRMLELDSILFRHSLSEIASKRADAQQELSSAKEQEQKGQAAWQVVRAREQEWRAQLLTTDLESDRLRTRIEACREDLNSRSNERTQMEGRFNEVKAFLSSCQVELARLEERKSLLQQRECESRQELEDLELAESDLSEQLRSLQQVESQDLPLIVRKIEDYRRTIRSKDQEIRDVRDRLISCQSKLSTIKNQLIAAAPINQLKESIGERAEALLQGIAPQIKLLVDGLRIPAVYTKAVQAVLAEKAGFLVTEDPLVVARSFVESNRDRAAAEASSIGFGVIRAGCKEEAPNRAVPFRCLLDLIEVEQDCQLAAQFFLGGVYIVATPEEAFDFMQSAAADEVADIILVTPEGDLLTRHSFYSLRHEGGLVQLKSEAVSLSDRCTELQESQDGLIAEREVQQQELAECEERHRLLLLESERRNGQIREASNQQGNLAGKIEASQRQLSQIITDVERLRQQISEVNAKICHYDRQQSEVELAIAALTPEYEEALSSEIAELSENLQSVEQLRKEGYLKLAEIAEEVEQERKRLDQIRARISSVELVLEKLSLEERHLRERICSDYSEAVLAQSGLVVDASASKDLILDQETRGQYVAELEALRTRIQREGEVDMSAIEQYQHEKARLDDLELQKRDLDQAVNILRRTIEKLTSTFQHRFIQTFEAVSLNFSRLVPRLFGGGKGALELTDAANPLDSGVDIVVRPPGKKLKSIELLSGGEKALAASALILAMFMERPSPICVLDEVDAPLDDANLVRFLALIKEMSARTQFMMITHNKQTMAAAGKLVGVTMEEPGATKLVTVSLEEAVQQVA